MEDMVVDAAFWRGRRVLITGHTGFKGGWLTLWLTSLDAEVCGFALPPHGEPSLYGVAGIGDISDGVMGDIRELDHLSTTLADRKPEVIFHLASQSLVRESYDNPVNTYTTNVIGTVNLLQAVRGVDSVKAVVVVTSDKCYENNDWVWGYRENEPMGGADPYSSSKGCAELVVSAMRRSFFDDRSGWPRIATARAGNVVGGGDWAFDRLVPDLIRAFQADRSALIRNPRAVRPWQHVLEPVAAYLLLAQVLYERPECSCGWNIGPNVNEMQPVSWMADQVAGLWGPGARWQIDGREQRHEDHILRLDCSKAKVELGWLPKLSIQEALALTVDWYRRWHRGEEMQRVTLNQIASYRRQDARQ